MAFQILIVDDNELFRQGLRERLEENLEWEVCGEAADGPEAIEASRKLAPQLVIMDFTMPRMSGLEASIQILKDFPGIPIILLTLYYTRQLAQSAHEAGIRATMSKTAMHQLSSEVEAICRSEGAGPRARARPA